MSTPLETSRYFNNAEDVFPFTIQYKDPSLLEEGIKTVVREIVTGWAGVPADAIAITVISGGITNLLYRVTLASGSAPSCTTRDVVVRVYGENTEVIIERERENRLFAELSRQGFAPPYLGRFTNGRIEGYLPARPLTPEEMGQTSPVDFVAYIARELARMHGMQIHGVCESEPLLWTLIDKWADLASEITFDSASKTAQLQSIGLGQLRSEVEWLRERLTNESHGSTRAKEVVKQAVFSHQDLLCGNILYSEGWSRVQFIDFEYGGYNFRGFDIANHFCEYAGYDPDYEKGYPRKDKQLHFLRSYVLAMGDGVDLGGDLDAFLEELYVVVNRYACAAHLFWGHWAIIQSKHSPIDFDFLTYAQQRLDGYYSFKKMFF